MSQDLWETDFFMSGGWMSVEEYSRALEMVLDASI